MEEVLATSECRLCSDTGWKSSFWQLVKKAETISKKVENLPVKLRRLKFEVLMAQDIKVVLKYFVFRIMDQMYVGRIPMHSENE